MESTARCRELLERRKREIDQQFEKIKREKLRDYESKLYKFEKKLEKTFSDMNLPSISPTKLGVDRNQTRSELEEEGVQSNSVSIA